MVGKSGQPFKKSRKYGESADDLQDRLDFVAALLALADEEITVFPDSLKAQFKVDWVKEDELRVSGTMEQKRRNEQTKQIEKGITKKDLGVLLETYRHTTILESARDELIQNALACLRDLEILKEHKSAKNQGYWKFSLYLKHQTATREENLQVIRDAWKEAFGELPQPKLESTPATLNRCILGLKGNYQDAQQKLSEITETLQNLLNDKTLSIAKVEEGSIILIVESSQTGYEQLKRLIGQEIAGFPVEYAIDEWQDICRRMLKQQTQLSSNSLLKAQFNRNLIEEELFIDLGLVQPKPQRHERPKDDIEPERGSEFFTRQEVEKRFAYREFLREVIGQRKQKNIAIVGEPGAGKTTLLQKLAFWLLQETDDLVIWIPLRNLGEKSLPDYLDEQWLKDALRDARAEIKADWEEKFKGSAVWLLLDGLDEMGDAARNALSLRGWVTQAQLIISCRLNLWQANPVQLQGFQTYLTQPFQDEQIRQFIGRWFGGVSGEGEDAGLAESLWAALETPGKERIKDLCRNPLRLTLLSSIWQGREGDLPDTTAKLYEKFVALIYQWKKEAFPVTAAEREGLNAGLGALAKASLDGEGTRFRLTRRLVREYLGERDENSLLDRALRLGWLNEVGVDADEPEDPVYAFYHATFQEYFAAVAVADWDYFVPRDHVDKPVDPPLVPPYQGRKQDEQKAPLFKGGWGDRYRIFEPQWKQVILLWLGREDVGEEEKEGFIRALVEFEDGVGAFYSYQAYFLAAAAINEFKACSLATEIVRLVVQWGFGYFNIEKQEWWTFLDSLERVARETIPETIRQMAISEMIKIIEDCPYEDTRRKAAESLGKIGQGNPEAIAALVKLIETTQDKFTRRKAAESLGKIDPGNPEAIAALVKLIETTRNEWTQREAAESLEKIDPGNPEAIAALVKLIETTQDEDTRREAAESLEKIGQGNPEAIAALVKVIETTQDEYIRRGAAESLEKIGQGNPEAIAALVKLIETTRDGYIRRKAAESLGDIGQGNPEAIAALVKVIETTQDEDTRRGAVESLGKIGQGNPEAIAALVKLIETTRNEWTQRKAAESLGKIDPGNPEAIAALVKVIETTQDETIRWLAAESLGDIDPGNPEAIAALVKLIETTQDEDTRRWAAESLGDIGQGNPEAIAALVKLIETTQDEKTRREAAWSLEKIGQGNPEAIAALVKLIETTQDEKTRREAAWSLGDIGQGNPEAIAALVKLIETTQDEKTRWWAADSLGKIDPGNPEAIAVLVKLIETTQDEQTRWWAADSLGKILTTRQQYAGVVSALKDNLSDEIYQNNFDRFKECYKLIWNCAANLPYPQFYQAWHQPPTTPYPEVEDNTPTGENATVDPLENALTHLSDELQDLPIYCLNAKILTTETRESEIAKTLCRLIWKQALPNRRYPRPTTPADLCYELDKLKLTLDQTELAILITHCETPTPELIEFCQKLTDTLHVAWLTEAPLEPPLKAFPPNAI